MKNIENIKIVKTEVATEGVLKNLAKFTGKQLCRSLFVNTVAGLTQGSNAIKKTLKQVFTVEFFKIVKNGLFTVYLPWLLL